MTQRGDLKVWWIPQVPMQAFEVRVANLVEAKLLLDVLAAYDLFQYETRVKGDYANAGGLSVWDGAGWVDWYSDTGEEFGHYNLAELREQQPKWEEEGVLP